MGLAGEGDKMASVDFRNSIQKEPSLLWKIGQWILGNQNQPMRNTQQILNRGPAINGNEIDFKSQTEELIKNAPMGPPAPSFGNRVLGSFLDYAKSPAGMQVLGAAAIRKRAGSRG